MRKLSFPFRSKPIEAIFSDPFGWPPFNDAALLRKVGASPCRYSGLQQATFRFAEASRPLVAKETIVELVDDPELEAAARLEQLSTVAAFLESLIPTVVIEKIDQERTHWSTEFAYSKYLLGMSKHDPDQAIKLGVENVTGYVCRMYREATTDIFQTTIIDRFKNWPTA